MLHWMCTTKSKVYLPTNISVLNQCLVTCIGSMMLAIITYSSTVEGCCNLMFCVNAWLEPKLSQFHSMGLFTNCYFLQIPWAKVSKYPILLCPSLKKIICFGNHNPSANAQPPRLKVGCWLVNLGRYSINNEFYLKLTKALASRSFCEVVVHKKVVEGNKDFF